MYKKEDERGKEGERRRFSVWRENGAKSYVVIVEC